MPLMDRTAVKLVVIARHRLDCDALASLLDSRREFQILCATNSTDQAFAVCQRRHPNVIVVDATLIGREIDYDVVAFLQHRGNAAVLLLDDAPHHHRLSCALKLPVVGYFTRDVGTDEFIEAITNLAAGRSAFDVGVSDVVLETSDGWRLREKQESQLSTLTGREIEVLRYIALGNTVRECAEKMQLAPSTVDNHKSRLMKKLGLHKTTELVRFAVREGVINE